MRLEENALPWMKNFTVLCFQQIFCSEVWECSSKFGQIIFYIYTHIKKNKIRVHTCSTETFSFLVSKYFWRLCPHLVLVEHSLTNKSSLKKVPWNIFQSALLEQKCFVEISFLMMFWSGKLLSVLKQEVISAGWKESWKRGIFIKSQSLLMRKTSIHQNPASQNSENCAKCHKNIVAPKVWWTPSPIT